MQTQFNINNGFQARQAMAQFRDVAALVSRQRIGAAKVDKKQVILLQIMAKGVLFEGTFPQLAHKVMLDISAPFVVAGSGQISETVGHDTSGGKKNPEAGAWWQGAR